MEKSKIVIRPLILTDLPNIVRIHHDNFPHSRSSKLGSLFLMKMYRWYLLFQPALAFGATIDKTLVGFVTGSIGNSAKSRYKYAFFEILIGLITHPHLFFHAFMFEGWRKYLLSSPNISKKSGTSSNSSKIDNNIKIALDSIAVNPSVRGKGIGKLLVQSFENAAKQQGGDYMSLGVELNNPSARKLYENCGWVSVNEDRKHNSANYRKSLSK